MAKKKKARIERLLVANRSEIACRIMRTAHETGIETVAVYSEPDRAAAHVAMADRAVALGGDSPTTSYLNIERIVEAALETGSDAVHPGYGFLAENAAFARACGEAGLVFVGPSADAIETMGDKIRARRLAAECGLPVIPSAGVTGDADEDIAAAAGLGFPVLVKAAAGGGGRGMRVVEDPAALAHAVVAARREAAAAFGDDRVYIEKYVTDPRHIEIQVFGDGRGKVLHLGERECSVQRRHQKIIEEAPSPFLDAPVRERMGEAAVTLAHSMDYAGAGTVEFVVDAEHDFYFLEMNTRLQVEHTVTEMVTSTDLVRWQLDIAVGGTLPEAAPPVAGHAVQCRVYAEDPAAGFVPTAGTIDRVEHPIGAGIRVESALYDGLAIPLEYDPMLAKIIVWAPDRQHAIGRMTAALEGLSILGITTNVPFLLTILADPRFLEGAFTTTTVEKRYADWRPENGLPAPVAAAAALLAATRPVGPRSGGRNSASVVAGPWETLGDWRLGAGDGRRKS